MDMVLKKGTYLISGYGKSLIEISIDENNEASLVDLTSEKKISHKTEITFCKESSIPKKTVTFMNINCDLGDGVVRNLGFSFHWESNEKNQEIIDPTKLSTYYVNDSIFDDFPYLESDPSQYRGQYVLGVSGATNEFNSFLRSKLSKNLFSLGIRRR